MNTEPNPSAAGDGRIRCPWCEASDAYRRYHDTEWGFPVTDDPRLFEKLCLEGFQAGLSWLTILHKREAFRARLSPASTPSASPRFGAADVARLLGDAGIVRHRGKIESTINNARRALELRRRVRLAGGLRLALRADAGDAAGAHDTAGAAGP